MTVLLCDGDGNLFPSEEPAFDASAGVVNDLLEHLGDPTRFSGEELRLATTGQNFRATATALARERGRDLGDQLESWVARERREVTQHLATILQPDHAVAEPLRRLALGHRLALVSSSASTRIRVCLAATRLEEFFPPEVQFSAEDSLPEPTSKPDPAIYLYALRTLGVEPSAAVAIEDSVPGVLSAQRAGIPVIGNVQFVPVAEREERSTALLDAGAAAVVSSWIEFEKYLGRDRVLLG